MKNIKSLFVLALIGSSFTSCNDFLNLDPLNDIVLENFWTDKSDVESVLLGAYSSLESSDCLQRMLVWGELRSDNVVEGNNAPDDIRQICNENLLITNGYCKYNKFYDVINRANTVLHYAPEVAKKDPNYIIDEELAHETEAKALRCLSYWYLIRSFHDVPYVTEPSIDDEGGHMKFYVKQSSFEVILDSLIKELEILVDFDNNFKNCYAVTKYSTEEATKARITKSAICAMLADMYLWRGRSDDWDKCIAVCEEVNKIKLDEQKKLKNKEGKNCEVVLFNGYPLITDSPDGTTAGNSYDEIYGVGNSFESIFEFPYNNDVKNPIVGDYYQSDQNDRNQSVGRIKAYEPIGNAPSANHDVFLQSNDIRYYQNLKQRGTSFAIAKYAYSSINLKVSSGKVENASANYGSMRSSQSSSQPNWIVYRYTEILLFEAEAYIMKAKALSPAGDDSLAIAGQQQEYKDKAFNLIDAVNARAIVTDNPQVSKNNTLAKATSYTSGTSVSKLEDILFQERRREFLYEGKRWYDLVRMARRDGNQTRLLSFIKKKHSAATSSAVDIKLKNPYAMYFPMAKDEVRNSQGVLVQNPAYRDDEKVEQAH